MLYALHEMQFASLTPVRLTVEALQQVFTNPWFPASHTPFGRTVAANCELLERSTRKYEKRSFDLTTTRIGGEDVPVHDDIVLTTNFCCLRHFSRPAGADEPRVLIVAPMSGHHATLLRDTVASMLPDHDIYITDWNNARDVPVLNGTFDLDDYIDVVIEFIRFLGPNTHVMAVCQPVSPVLAAVSLMAAEDDPAQPASLTLMGGPIDARINPTQVNDLAMRRPLQWFAETMIDIVPMAYPGAGRRVYPGFIQLTGFVSMNPDRHVDAHLKLYEQLVAGDGDSAEKQREFYDEFLSVMDLPADFYLDTIRTVFQEHCLPRGTLVSRGRKVDPSRIRRTALMTVEGGRDDITGRGQCQAAHQLCSALPESMRRHHLEQDVGHFGVFNGRRWREGILPNVREFIRCHDRLLARKAS